MRVMMQSKQMEMDEAFAASLLYDDDQTDDQAVAREWQNMENSLISLSDDEKFAKSLQEQELNRSTSTQQQSHVGSSSHDSSDDSTHSLPPDVNIDPDNMTYEENRSEQSTKDCRRGELAKYQLINLPRRLEREILYPKKLSKTIICMNSFKINIVISLQYFVL
ncbi:hypothetical protein AT5G52130 [Arabidopsis thaliana]|uniref:Uncharacterized protein n=1 Tax=Arabidopsis thaliana TaxID=3702 RepID=Q9LTK7_ARATH|nr:uncharacterized protein AT5G52130 [Arabidopsis thaliana]AED96175.1 hypothetical protein AT5G52130 [Arabidopsis thaliana]BAA97456.1 unnamed protein product [Arabidopsis thaliana]|eukprot:NP_200026.1 hypothetical protein AT5G52130 [Arabidopsis thaliana]